MDLQTMLNVVLTIGFIGTLCKVRKLERDLYTILLSVREDLRGVLESNIKLLEEDFKKIKEKDLKNNGN